MAKMQISKEIIINAPLKNVWDTFSKLEEWPSLCSNITKIYWTSGEKWSLKSTFTQIVKDIMPFRIISRAKVIGIMPGKSAAWTGTRSLIRGIHTFKFENINKKTMVINMEYFKGPLAWMIFPFIKSKFEIYFETFLSGLKRKAENNKKVVNYE